MIRGSWIPPFPLAAGAIFGAASWLLVLAYAIAPSFALQLAWVHTVALGSFTIIALSVLIHVVPGFTGLVWRGGTIARWCAALLPFAVLGMVASFLAMNAALIALFATIIAAGIVLYVVAAVVTLSGRPPERTEAAIARALAGALLFLGAAAVLGSLLAHGLTSGNATLLRLAPSHASIALIGWLTLLVMGVSAQTFGPLLRAKARWRILHIASNTGMLLCAVIVAFAFALGSAPWVTAGFSLGFISALLYAADGFDRVARATTPHRPAHVFAGAALAWLICAAAAALLGAYPLAIAVALAGWIGQMINAHLHHLGIRVIATTFAGDENESRPWELLDQRVEWFTAIAAQCAVACIAAGILTGAPGAFAAAAACGLAATASLISNVRIAVRNARNLPITL